MERFKCTQKQYGGNGEIVAYNLMDEQGVVRTYDRDTVKDAIKQKAIEVVNLQISSDGRLVDKAIKLEKQSTVNDSNNQKVISYAYECGYRSLLHGGTVVFEKININGQLVSKFYDEVDKVLKKAKLDTKLDAYQMAQGFENYLKQKNCFPLRLQVKLNMGNHRHCILYGLTSVYMPVFGDWYDAGEHNQEIYLNENNYKIDGICLDTSQPIPISIMGINNENEKNVVKIRGNTKDFPKNVPYMILEKGTSADGKYKNVFIGVELRKGLTDKHIIIDVNKGMQKRGNRSALLENTRFNFNQKIYSKLNTTFLGKLFLQFSGK